MWKRCQIVSSNCNGTHYRGFVENAQITRKTLGIKKGTLLSPNSRDKSGAAHLSSRARLGQAIGLCSDSGPSIK
jgi:hypothetical protein